MIGSDGRSGRLNRATTLARELDLPVIADDTADNKKAAFYDRHEILNLNDAYNTWDEVISALAHSRTGGVLFVTSLDHLPRVVRDAMAQGATNALFASSDVPFFEVSPSDVQVLEPKHQKH